MRRGRRAEGPAGRCGPCRGLTRLPWSAAFALFLLAASAHGGWAVHDPFRPAHRPPHDPRAGCGEHARSGSGGELDPATREYYLAFFAHLVEEAALEGGDEYVRLVGALAENVITLGRVETHYAELRASLPVVVATWDGTVATLVSSPPVLLARDVPRLVLVEVENLDHAAQELVVEPEGSRPSVAAVLRRGQTRGFLVRLRVEDPETQARLLTIRSLERRDAVSVPVQTVEPATIVGTTLDAESGEPLPARVEVRSADGEFRHGIAYRDIATLSTGRVPRAEYLDYKNAHFYSDGSFELQVPPGPVTVRMERGFEFREKSVAGHLAPGETRTLALSAGRFVDMRARDWISGETHVHWVRGPLFENEDIDLLGVVQRAEDIQVVNNLTLRHRNQVLGVEWLRPDHAPMGPVPGHDSGPYRIQMGQEQRNDPFYGHVSLLNLIAPPRWPAPAPAGEALVRRGLVPPVSTGDLLGPHAEDYPLNCSVIDRALAQRPPASRPLIVAAHGIAGETPADVVLGRIDSLDQVLPEDYYRFLDCGLRLALTDGADFPGGAVGRTRCYVRVQPPLTYGGWIDGILAGETFVTSGPLLWMTVDGEPIGARLARAPGDTIRVRVEAHSRHPIGRLQVLSNHEVLHDAVHDGTTAVVNLALTSDVSRWIVARCSSARPPTFRPFQEPGAAHTSATYVLVDGKRIFVDSGAAEFLRDLCAARGEDVYENGLFAPPGARAKRTEARDYFFAGRDAYQAILDAHP